MRKPSNKQLITTIEWVEQEMKWGKFAEQEEKEEKKKATSKKPRKKTKKEIDAYGMMLIEKRKKKWAELKDQESSGVITKEDVMKLWSEWLNSKDYESK